MAESERYQAGANVMEKLDIHSRTELVKYAIRKGLVQVEA